MRRLATVLVGVSVVLGTNGCSGQRANDAEYTLAIPRAMTECVVAIVVREKWADSVTQRINAGTQAPPSYAVSVAGYEFVAKKCRRTFADLARVKLPNVASGDLRANLEGALDKCKNAALEAADAATRSARFADQVVGNPIATREFMDAGQRLRSVSVDRVQPCMQGMGEVSREAGLKTPTAEALTELYMERESALTAEFERELQGQSS